MTIYGLYIFNREGTCLLNRRYNQSSSSTSSKSAIQQQKLMWGLLYSLKDFVKQLTPNTLDENEQEPFHSFTTSEYKVHYLETPHGLRIVLTSDPALPRLHETLGQIYKLYVEYVVKNPLYTLGQPIQAPVFQARLEGWMESLPFFK